MAKKRGMSVQIPASTGRRVLGSRLLPVLGLGLAVAGIMVGCAAPPPEVSTDDPGLVLGRDIYARACASCHGSDGGGGVGQALKDGAVIEAYPTIEDQIALVAAGKNNMPAFGDRLSEEEQLAVARYVREVLSG